MDATAIAFCRDNKIPIVVFDMSDARQPARHPRGREGRHHRPLTRPAPGRGTMPGGDPATAAGYAGAVIEETLLEAIDKMDKAVGHVQSQFQTVRTGRAAPALVEKLTIEYYGAPGAAAAARRHPGARRPASCSCARTTAARWRRSRRRSATPTSGSTRATTAPSSGSPSRRSPRSGAGSTSRSSSTWPRRAGSRCATCAATPASTSRDRSATGEISADELERAEKELEKITHDHVEAIDAALGRKETELLEV